MIQNPVVPPLPRLPLPRVQGPAHAWRLTRWSLRDLTRALPYRLASMPASISLPTAMLLVGSLALICVVDPAILLWLIPAAMAGFILALAACTWLYHLATTAADAQQVTVHALASHPTVANIYKSEMPELIAGPTNRLGSIPLHRNPTPRASRT